MSLINYIIQNKKKNPKKISYIFENDFLTNEQLYNNIGILSENLKKLGIRKGDKIAIIYGNSIIFPQIFYTAAYLDLSIIPLNPSLSEIDIINQINKLKIKFLFSWSGFLSRLNFDKVKLKKKNCFDLESSSKKFSNYLELTKKKGSHNIVLKKKKTYAKRDFLFSLTSGSTSDPKVIIWSQYVKIKRGLHAKKMYQLSHRDRIIIATPIYHSISFRLIVLSIVLGSTCVILKKFTVKDWFKNLKKWKITFSILVSDQIEMISNNLNKPYVKKNFYLKKLVSCCSILKEKIKLRLINQPYLKVYDTYGASEVGTITNIDLKNESKKIKSNGKATSGYDLRIFHNSKMTKKPLIHGEICCKTKNVFSGYFYLNRREKNDEISNDFFRTGDVGYLDKDGYLYLTGRKKELIIRGGVNIFPSDIEKVLNNFTNIKESAVIGFEDKNLGQMIYAFLKFKKNNKINKKKFLNHCLKKLADFQIPSKFFIINEFPRTSLNKISKFMLKENILEYTKRKQLML